MNYYRAVQKKPEHGGGWAFMQLNRREGRHPFAPGIQIAASW